MKLIEITDFKARQKIKGLRAQAADYLSKSKKTKDPIKKDHYARMAKDLDWEASELEHGELTEGIFDFLKKKLVKKNEVDLIPIDKEQRDFVSSVFPHTNANLKWDSKEDSKYVVPYNINGTYGRGKLSFYINHGQLYAGVALHGSASDAGNPKVVPLAHYEVAIKSKADLEKLKADLE